MVESPARRWPVSGVAQLPPALLTASAFLGTLAAVRSFGRAGIACIVANDSRFGGAASWSRFVSRQETCPPDSQPEQLVEWLLTFGKAHPGHVLCATSDESAWLYAKYRTELGEYFYMYQPSVEAIYSLLNKHRLYDIGRAENIDFPPTWFPHVEDDLRTIAQEARFPVLIKPVTQILHKTHTKGAVIGDPIDLSRFFLFMAGDMYQQELRGFDPSIGPPMFQEFDPPTDGVYSISGFIDDSGTMLGVRATQKVLQRPRRLGVGVCFERAEIKPELVDAITRLCRRVGYYGVFEVEFIQRDGRSQLIDFNPRFYGQMAFDIARGLPVPLMAYYAALGDRDKLTALASTSQRQSDDTAAVYCNRIDFEMMLRGQRLSRAMSAKDVQGWRDWYKAHRGHITHALIDRDDWKPFAIELVRQFLAHVRHPRASLRSSMLKALLISIQLQQQYV